MYLESGRLVLSPTDLVGYLHCGHLTQLSLEVATGARTEPEGDDPQLAVMRDRGLEHEYAYLDHLRGRGRTIVDIASDGELDDRATATVDALRSGADVIYQATFVDRPESGPIWRGHADFLRRVEVPSELGRFSYEPEDTKLARQVRPSAVIQLCAYAEGLGRAQGHPPEQVHVVLGGEDTVPLRLADFAAYHRAAKARFEQATADGIASYPFPVQHCAVCSWRADCDARRRRRSPHRGRRPDGGTGPKARSRRHHHDERAGPAGRRPRPGDRERDRIQARSAGPASGPGQQGTGCAPALRAAPEPTGGDRARRSPATLAW